MIINMEKVILFNMDNDNIRSIYNICSKMRIGVIAVDSEQNVSMVEDIMKLPLYKGGTVNWKGLASPTTEESLLLMCGLTDKHMDRLLASLRNSHIQPDYKAVLTPSNKKWTVTKLLAHMAFEKYSYN